MNLKTFFPILILLSFATSSFCSDQVITVGTLEDYAPFCQKIQNCEPDGIFPPDTDSKGFEGYSWDVVRESFHEMGYTIKLIVTPWARAMKNVQNGTIDVLFPTGQNTERQQQFYYSKEPVNQANFLIYVRKHDPIKWKGLQSLDGLVIGVKRGFNYGDKWNAMENIQKQSVSTILQGFKMLDFKRLDGFAGYEINWDYALHKAHLENKYKKLPIFDFTNEYLIALKTNPRSIEILKAFDIGKQRLMANGKLHEIEKKWSGQ